MEVVEIDWTIIEESRDDHADQGCQPPNSLSIIRQVDQQTPNHAIHQSKDLILELPAKNTSIFDPPPNVPTTWLTIILLPILSPSLILHIWRS